VGYRNDRHLPGEADVPGLLTPGERRVNDIEPTPLDARDAAEVHALVAANRAHLDRWLRWSASVRTLADVEAMIARFQRKLAAGDGFHCGIRVGGVLAGGVVCWYIDRDNRNAEVGYWLDANFTGRGLATGAARWAVARLFTAERVHRIELQCAVRNTASRAVARRLGFQEEGIRRESHWVTDRFVDHVIYGILDREWTA
jgi:ribosomal-protein-serine acetyltransferase